MLFFSNTILPMENMSNIIYKLSYFNPFVLAETALRKSMVFGLSITSVWKEFLLLSLWILVIVILILMTYKQDKAQTKQGIKNITKQTKERVKKIIFVEE